jgi:phosphoheptose isomerase
VQAGDYLRAYRQTLFEAWQSVDPEAANRAADMLTTAIGADRLVFAGGNGGSAAVANHLACDCLKGIQTDTPLRPRVISLVSTIELITAIANDLACAEVFAYQLRSLARHGDVLITSGKLRHCRGRAPIADARHAQYLRQQAMPPELIARRRF